MGQYKHFLAVEFYSSILLGSMPSFLLVIFSGIDGLKSFISSLGMSSELLVYFFILYLVLIGLLYLQSVGRFEVRQRTWRARALDTLEQAGTSIVGVYRVIAGMLIVVGIAAALHEANAKAYAYGLYGIFFAASSISVFAYLQYKAHQFRMNN